MTYDVQIERDESGAWLARVPSVPGCHTYGRSLRQVRHRIGEALGLWIDDADQAELAFHYHLPSAIRSELARARAARQRAAAAQRDAQKVTRTAAQDMSESFGLSLRDAAELLGLSHQRVQQLLASDDPG